MSEPLFKPFEVGKVFNPVTRRLPPVKLQKEQITIEFPSRLEAMALDPSKIAENKNMVFTAGQINFVTDIKRILQVSKVEGKESLFADAAGRTALIKHAIVLMRHALNFNEAFKVRILQDIEFKHAGLGSSSSLIAAVCTAINEMYGNPIRPQELARYVAQNHGEEIKNNDRQLMAVQSMGGSVCGGLFNGSVHILAGESTIIYSHELPESYEIILGVPSDYKPKASGELQKSEEENIDGFRTTGQEYSEKIAYDVLHNGLPGLSDENLKSIGDLIFSYRFNWGSIENCSFVYPRMTDIASRIRYLYEEQFVEILALSSVGPGFFAIGKDLTEAKKSFKKNNLKVVSAKPFNGKYVAY